MRDDKYQDNHIFMRNRIMATTIQELTFTDDEIEAEREIIRNSLDEIVREVGARMGEAGLTDPVFLTVPNSGQAILTMGTPADPSLEDWHRITKIVCIAVSDRLDGARLRSRALPCAMVNATMNAADVIAD
jgi:hypothetical protein